MTNKFEYLVLESIDNAVKNSRLSPLILGGGAGPSGGGGGPPGGFSGKLPQSRVTYDTTEAASLSGVIYDASGILISGSLVDNLNHIRYRIQTLESGGSGGSPLSIYDDGVLVASGVSIVDFGTNLSVSNLGLGHVLISGYGSGTVWSGNPSSIVLTNDTTGQLETLPWIKFNSITKTFEFGADDLTKEINAGKIGYASFDSEFDITGAGTLAGSRNIHLYDNVVVDNQLSATTMNINLGSTYNINGSPHTHDYLTEAPIDGNTYGRNNASWTIFSGGGSSVPGGSTTDIQVNISGALYGNSKFTYDPNTRNLVLGGSPPILSTDDVHLMAEGTSPAYIQWMFWDTSSDTIAPGLQSVRAGGTIASPTATLSGMGLNRVVGKGYDGLAWNNTITQGQMFIVADGDWDATSRPVRIDFHTTPVGATSKILATTIESNGQLNTHSHKITSLANGSAASDAATVGQIPNKNIVINGGFTINQRGYVSAATLAAGAYSHDRWKAGTGGGDYSFTQLASPTTITIAANKTLIQVIEDKMVAGGTYTLSWSGTCKARYAINSATPAGAYASSPIVISGQSAGTVMSIEFGNDTSSGTLGNVQLELSTIATTFEFRPYTLELLLCLPYFRKVRPTTLVANGTTVVWSGIPLFPPMRTTPTVTQDVVLGITDIVSANFNQTSAVINGVGGAYLGTDFLFVNYGNFVGLTSGRLYYVQPALSNAPTLVSAEL